MLSPFVVLLEPKLNTVQVGKNLAQVVCPAVGVATRHPHALNPKNR